MMKTKLSSGYPDLNSENFINENPEAYGSKGESWSEEFVIYMKSIVTHPVYKNMPDALKEDGRIQWEAPSNRRTGKYQYTHQKRREWWQNKANEVGIDINSNKWISKTAKTIHPTGEKPCKRCGQILRISYSYPRKNLIKRIEKEFGSGIEISRLDTLPELVQNIFDTLELNSMKPFQKILKTSSISVPDFGTDIDAFLLWIEDEYIPSEPSLLSPGAMSNPPDRFDGFHSFNLCCRGKADKGRTLENLKSYSTDRRVFEFWSEGNWIAADRLMGLVRAKLKNERNADGGSGSPTADHIGPLSLGFCHRPEFRLLSKEANSAKNNRMTYEDVKDLIKAEKTGTKVVSWYAKPLWDLMKNEVVNEETALRLSKMLRDNQRNAMVLFSKLLEIKAYTFLSYLLELNHAEYNISFTNLRSENFITKYDSMVKQKRNTKYSIEQKARRLRVGFESLRGYVEKENRHLQIIEEKSLNHTIQIIEKTLLQSPKGIKDLNHSLEQELFPDVGSIKDLNLRNLVTKIPEQKIELFEEVKTIANQHMIQIAKTISKKWENDRYVRNNFDLN